MRHEKRQEMKIPDVSHGEGFDRAIYGYSKRGRSEKDIKERSGIPNS